MASVAVHAVRLDQTQERATSVHITSGSFGGSEATGAQAPSVIVRGWMVSERIPSLAETGFCAVHAPFHAAGASKETVLPPGRLHAVVLAVSVEGSAQAPADGPHLQEHRPGSSTLS